MGVDVERFVCEINDGLLCCICRDVLEDPVQAPCEHAYCQSCIHGWLVNECSCPEDRQTLFLSDLRPLFRYMRNDLDRLRLYCQYSPQGCQHICTMESIRGHESNCDHATVTCPHPECSLTMTRRELQEHVQLCHSSSARRTDSSREASQQCAMGCGLLMLTHEEKQHNCISELRANIEVLRAEMTCKMEDQRREMEARLDMQRGHMVQREAVLHGQIEALKVEVNRLSDRLKALMEVETERRRQLDRMTTERAEIMALLRRIQREQQENPSCCPNCSGSKTKVTPV